MDKLTVARAQLGTALDLFIRDKDPVSVQSLAASGCAVVDGLAETAGSYRMADHVLKHVPGMSPKDYYALRNQFWNAFKHVSTQDGVLRDDGDLITGFSDQNNDIILFVGWHDYMLLTHRLPVEAQVFQVWWYALNPERLAPEVADPSRDIFPGLVHDERKEQKRRLARAVEKWRDHKEVMAAKATERLPLSPRVKYDR